jgi:hypothetical protein
MPRAQRELHDPPVAMSRVCSLDAEDTAVLARGARQRF